LVHQVGDDPPGPRIHDGQRVVQVLDYAVQVGRDPGPDLTLRSLRRPDQFEHALQRRFGLLQQAANEARSRLFRLVRQLRQSGGE
jgi:hypothetical protein